jgi:hypothetical protein
LLGLREGALVRGKCVVKNVTGEQKTMKITLEEGDHSLLLRLWEFDISASSIYIINKITFNKM